MLIQDLVDPKSSFGTNNKPKDLTPDEEISEVEKSIMAARVRHYIERDARLYSNINITYVIIWGKCTQGLQSLLKLNEDYPTKSKNFDSLWLMWDKNKITAGLDVKLNKSSSLYNAIQVFMNMKQDKTDPNNTFKLRFEKIY